MESTQNNAILPDFNHVPLESMHPETIIVHPKTDIPYKDPSDDSFSVDVITYDKNGMLNIAYYDFEAQEWSWHGDTVVDPYEFGEVFDFVWMYKPNCLNLP